MGPRGCLGGRRRGSGGGGGSMGPDPGPWARARILGYREVGYRGCGGWGYSKKIKIPKSATQSLLPTVFANNCVTIEGRQLKTA